MLKTLRRWRHPAVMILLLIAVAAAGYRTWRHGHARYAPVAATKAP